MKSTVSSGDTSRVLPKNNSKTVLYNAVPGMDLSLCGHYILKQTSGFIELNASWSTMLFGASFFQGASMAWSGAQFGFKYFEKV